MRILIDNGNAPATPRPRIGHYGRLRKAYLEGYRPDLYTALVASEKLYPHCAEIDAAAQSRLDLIMPGLARSAGATEALKAAETLSGEGIECRVVDMHTIKPLDEEEVLAAAKEIGKIVTAEEHSVVGGLGSAVASFTAGNCPCRVEVVGVRDVFGQSGSPGELMEHYGLSAQHIAQAVRRI